MLPFFPAPYPDELLYSICARYHIRSQNPSIRSTVQELFGVNTACAVIDLPSHLAYLSSQLPPGTLNTPERLISNNTLLPFYSHFLPKKRLKKLIGWMKGSTCGNRIHCSTGIMASSVPAPRMLRYCPECLVENCKEFGETYWHRSHQVAGVRLCHKHGAWLVDDDQSAPSVRSRHSFIAAPDPNPLEQVTSFQSDAYFHHYHNIAHAIAWLLNQTDVSPIGLQAICGKYESRLRQLDLISFAGRVAQRELAEQFLSFYEEDFLAEIHCSIDPNQKNNWLTEIVRRSDKTNHPLRHILLINFFGLKPEEFFMEKIRPQFPFGRGPWPCLNPVAPHYKQFVISKCVLSRHTVTGKPVGNFYCSCGFSYARTGPDRVREDCFRRSRMISFGPVWEEELLRLVSKENMALRPASQILGVDFNTVARNYYRLTEKKTEKVICPVKEGERQVRRERWLALIAANPGAGKSELFNMARADEAWLYRHDREWLSKNVPEKKKRQQAESRVDWGVRDKELATKILPAAKKILENPGRSIRVSKSALLKKLDLNFVLRKHIDQLPLTNAELDRVVESQEAFQIRRVRYAVKDLMQHGKLLCVWRIERAACLQPGYSAAVKAEIDRAISMAEENSDSGGHT